MHWVYRFAFMFDRHDIFLTSLCNKSVDFMSSLIQGIFFSRELLFNMKNYHRLIQKLIQVTFSNRITLPFCSLRHRWNSSSYYNTPPASRASFCPLDRVGEASKREKKGLLACCYRVARNFYGLAMFLCSGTNFCD